MLVDGDGLTQRSRTFAEARMRDTCRITKPGTGERVLDPVTRKYVDPPSELVYEGRCRFSSQSSSQGGTGAATRAGEATWVIQQSILHLPVAGTELVNIDQTVTMTAAAFDAALVGRQFGIVGTDNESQASDRRCVVNRTVN